MSLFARPVIVALLLAVAAITGCSSEPETVTITIHYSAFEPADLTVPRGVPVTLILVNEDPIDHEWLIGAEGFHEAHRSGTHASHGGVPTEVTVPALETASTTLTFDEAGKLDYICHLPGHESYGKVGTLTVSG